MERVTKKIVIFSVTTNTDVEDCGKSLKGKLKQEAKLKIKNKNLEEENE